MQSSFIIHIITSRLIINNIIFSEKGGVHMEGYQFETKQIGDVILIPDKYKGKIPKDVTVIVLWEEEFNYEAPTWEERIYSFEKKEE